MKNEKKYYRIIHVEMQDDSRLNEEKTVICRYCSEEKIEQEIVRLNKNHLNYVEFENYYEYEELFFSENENSFGDQHYLPSYDVEINRSNLRSALIFARFLKFDEAYSYFSKMRENAENKNIEYDFKSKFMERYKNYFTDKFSKNDFISLVEKLKKEGYIKSEIEFLKK